MSSGFEALRDEWYARLKAEGFKDIEQPNGRLKNGEYRDRVAATKARDSASPEYYRAAGWWLHEGTFPTLTAERIWALHADGVSVRRIARRMMQGTAASPRLVQDSIAESRARMFEALRSGAVGPDDERPEPSLWEQAMEAEGWDPKGQPTRRGGYHRPSPMACACCGGKVNSDHAGVYGQPVLGAGMMQHGGGAKL